MSVIDPISDMLSRVRNAYGAYHKNVDIPASKMKQAIAGILKDQGYVTDYSVEERNINIQLKYSDGKPLVTGLRKVSKPGRRVYVGAGEIPSVQNGIGICILSTSRGVMEGAQARAENVGGELLCEIW
ncbi:small subunit ribosomal protein S8 [Paucidesulfovibrio gracilis DSM 16080]|uniref:Small ribosomal subunit protein uS8 n=1 Tax=Paucidesulfovibrio gracilis DSM 16080 TaxID=1121449 RepID=A0A1T4WCJ4_9BACT|nr:30S ribosomal protein S8 [Paucidesulfovibrio gracilis]SKA74758.1 small subunit ribosomal protein S8 [Paucidesulfovibrio gracilis DSM 16080]